MKRLKLIGFLLCAAGFASAQNTWVKKAYFGGDKRERAIAFSIGDMGYVGTGIDTAEQVHNDLWQYNPGSNSWTQKASIPGSARRNAFAFAIDNIGYVGGGYNAAQTNWSAPGILADLWAYDPTTNSWSPKAPYPGANGQGIYYATAFVLDSKGYVCGGKWWASNYTNQLWQYNPVTDQWLQGTDFPNLVPNDARYQLASFVVKGRAFVGLGTDENAYNNDLWEYLPATNSWVQMNNFPGAERGAPSAFTIGDRAFLGLGTDGGPLDDFWEYDPDADYWYTRAPFPGGERRNAIAFVANGKAYVGTGDGLTGKRRNVYEYTPIEVLSVQDEKGPVTVATYPNPCTDILNFEVATQNGFRVKIFDMSGKMVTEFGSSTDRGSVSCGSWRSGQYMIAVFDEDGQLLTRKQFVKS